MINTLRPRQNGCHFTHVTLKRISFNENVRILLKVSLKLVPRGPINYIPSMVQIMAWRRPGDKPLSESMMVNLLTYICITRPQWINNTSWWITRLFVNMCECDAKKWHLHIYHSFIFKYIITGHNNSFTKPISLILNLNMLNDPCNPDILLSDRQVNQAKDKLELSRRRW